MKKEAFLSVFLLTLGAWAQTATLPNSPPSADSSAALTRYESDMKLCNDEPTASARLQCRRDAKQEYDNAIAAAKAKADASTTRAVTTSPVVCNDCGKVVEISVTEKAGEGGAAGLIAGGVGGALLGHQIGKGTGKDIATIAGAVGGAYAGKKIEEKIRTHKVWHVGVQYADGSKRNFTFDHDPGFKVGDSVRNSNQSLVRE